MLMVAPNSSTFACARRQIARRPGCCGCARSGSAQTDKKMLAHSSTSGSIIFIGPHWAGWSASFKAGSRENRLKFFCCKPEAKTSVNWHRAFESALRGCRRARIRFRLELGVSRWKNRVKLFLAHLAASSCC